MNGASRVNDGRGISGSRLRHRCQERPHRAGHRCYVAKSGRDDLPYRDCRDRAAKFMTGAWYAFKEAIFAELHYPGNLVIVKKARGRERRNIFDIVPKLSWADRDPVDRIAQGSDILVWSLMLNRLNINWRLDAIILAHGAIQRKGLIYR